MRRLGVEFDRIGWTLLEQMSEAVYVSGVDRSILYLNPACERLLGERAQGVVGRPCHTVFGSDEHPCPDPCAAEVSVRAGWSPSDHEVHFRVASGELAPFRATCIPVLDDDREVLYLIHLLQPVDAAVAPWARVRESESRYRTLFNHVTDAVFIATPAGDIVEANDEACRRLGYSREEFLALSPRDFDSPEYRSQVPERMRQITEHGVATFESVHVARDGTVIPVEVNARLCEFRGTPAVLAVCRDIRQRKRAEAQRQRDQEALEAAYEELLALNARLAEVDRLKTDLLSNVSHELRTPLVTLRGYTELMHGGKLGPLDDRQLRAVSVMQTNLHQLLDTIDRLLSFSSLERGLELEPLQPVDLKEICAHAIERYQAKAQEADITLEASCPHGSVSVKGDRALLEQLVLNLLDNAIKFSRRGGRVEVSLTTPGDGVASLSVSDSGIGIAVEDHERVFERFHQVDSTSTRERGGTGIGLSLVRAIAKHHQGEVRLRSEPDAGSCFTVKLPVCRSEGRD